MQIDGRTSPTPFQDNHYSVQWPTPSAAPPISGPPPYFFSGYQQQQLYEHQTVESHPRDHIYSHSHYGIRQPEVVGYPESSQRTHVDESPSSSMYRLTSRPPELSPNPLRGLARSGAAIPGDRNEANVPNERSVECESPAVDCEPRNFPLERHPSRFTPQQPALPTPQISLASATFLPLNDEVPFPYRQFYSEGLPRVAASPANTSSTREVPSFVDRVEPTATEFDTAIPSTSTSALSSYRDQNPQPAIIGYQMAGSLPMPPVDDSDMHQSFGDNSVKYHSPDHDTKYSYDSAHIATPPPSLPPLSSPGLRTHWSESSLSSAFREQSPDHMAYSEPNSPPPSHSGSESSAHPSESHLSRRSTSDAASSASSATLADGTRRRVKKKKKSKMHECSICKKQFPRPSGLTTHQNSHSGTKPFKCSFPTCDKSFTVRSNAKRHLRTHGIFPDSSEQVPGPCFAGFSPPIVSNTPHHMVKATTKLKWIPQSLSTRANAATLKSCLDSGSEVDEKHGDCIYSAASLCPPLPAPLPAVLPSSPAVHLGDDFEERNSFSEAGSQPYHPAQWRVLPGPAAVLRTQAAVTAV